jgi:predicted dehydrogenase
MAVSLSDAEAMAVAASRSDRITLLGYSFAKNPLLLAAKRLVEEGLIGRVFDFRGFIR